MTVAGATTRSMRHKVTAVCVAALLLLPGLKTRPTNTEVGRVFRPGNAELAAQSRYLTAAEDAARWVRASAIKTDAGLTWPADPTDPTSVNNGLYSGAPGVVLFLLELHHATGNRVYLDEARAGADELLAALPNEKQAGLYTGIAGIGFTLGEVYRATKDLRYREGLRSAWRLLVDRRLKDQHPDLSWGPVTDIISGNAGIGLFLLYAARTADLAIAASMNTGVADGLIKVAIPEHGGLKWHMAPNSPRLMPNFSHGTAGIAYFLARASEEAPVEVVIAEPFHDPERGVVVRGGTYSDDRLRKKYLAASLAGAKYLQAIAKTEGDICLIPHNQPDGLDMYYLGWCHGPVGTARLWYQLAKITGDNQWLTWVDRAANAILKSGIPEKRTPGFWNNVSQCCGTAGVAQFFLDLHNASAAAPKDKNPVLKSNPAYLAFAKKMTDDLLARGTRDDKGLRWVQAEHRVRPELLIAQTGYMQGAAGIGMWLLRLDAAGKGQHPFVRFPDTPWQ